MQFRFMFPVIIITVVVLKIIEEIFWIEVKEPYPELDGGQNIRRARGPAQFNRYINYFLNKPCPAVKVYSLCGMTKATFSVLNAIIFF